MASTSISPIPAPYVWPSSTKFDGSDGKWSTFAINVGDSGEGVNGQSFRVLPSLSTSITLIPGNVTWCDDRPDRDACQQSRGIEVYMGAQSAGFMTEQSPSWEPIGVFSVELGPVFGAARDNGTIFGNDNVGMTMASFESPTLTTQTVGLITNEQFLLGMFGLSDKSVLIGGRPLQTFLSAFKDNRLIPSFAFGYTAGAFYRDDVGDVLGSLVLGGYDASRLNSSQQAFLNMTETNGMPSLVAPVQSIRLADANNKISAGGDDASSFYVFIDSDLPYLVLPDGVCDDIAAFYNLEYNNEAELYAAAGSNTEKTMSIVVENVEIELPYEALNLTATWPLVQADTNYFPLKRSTNGKFVLGRAFLQEAYVIVDYERRNFSISQAVSNSAEPSSIVPIISPEYLNSTWSEDNGNPENSNGNPENPIDSTERKTNPALIGGAATAAVICIVAIIWLAYLFRRRKKAQRKNSPLDELWSHLKPELDGQALNKTHDDPLIQELHGTKINEVDGESLRRELEGAPVNELECTSSRSELPTKPDSSESSSLIRFRETSARGELSELEG